MPRTTCTHVVAASARLNAPPDRVYETIANYHSGHPRILPKQFRGLTVERGGIGAGTVIRFDLRLLGRTERYRAEISEPEPGRVLVEKNIAGNDATTTFFVDPGTRPNESMVTIQTELTVRRGVAGAIERFLTTRLLCPLYEREMWLLEAAASGPAGTAGSATTPA